MNNGKYCPEIVEEIASYIEQGETNISAIKKAGISEAVFYKWKHEHVEFVERLKKAEATYKEWELNGMLKSAKQSLKKLIEGYEYTEIENEYEADGKGGYTIKKQKSKTKNVGPNVTAVIFALVNRDPENWQNRINTEVKADVKTEDAKLDLSKIPDELLAEAMKYVGEAK